MRVMREMSQTNISSNNTWIFIDVTDQFYIYIYIYRAKNGKQSWNLLNMYKETLTADISKSIIVNDKWFDDIKWITD